MYHIGICDDDATFISYIKRLFLEERTDIEFYEYLSGEELLQNMQTRDTCDLLILDVFMPGMDGNETARKFRNLFPDTLLVFCSGVCMPTVESFETTPFRYWLKEYPEEKMRREVQTALEKLKKSKAAPCLMGRSGGLTVRLPLDRISYIAIARRGAVIYGRNAEEKYASNQRIGELYELLRDFGFAYAHNSYIVNLKYVAAAGPKELKLLNGERLSISRARAKEFQKAFAIELAGKYGEEALS